MVPISATIRMSQSLTTPSASALEMASPRLFTAMLATALRW
eukprot:CAMPEP_0181283318 /NCGR_PEP_ID=MMETSP1097-20121128/14720_1 /TAXON_ID=35684 /ORGANISM="Pseudopedinella elastica, Strain CCMP716" /LENGTH=40 /DNA_ID= /DNA_START= /DNA_END= /DNA_ORIENTATION=